MVGLKNPCGSRDIGRAGTDKQRERDRPELAHSIGRALEKKRSESCNSFLPHQAFRTKISYRVLPPKRVQATMHVGPPPHSREGRYPSV